MFVCPPLASGQVGAKYSDHSLGLHSLYTPGRSCPTGGNCHKRLHNSFTFPDISIPRLVRLSCRQCCQPTPSTSNTKIIFTFPRRRERLRNYPIICQLFILVLSYLKPRATADVSCLLKLSLLSNEFYRNALLKLF